MQYEVLATDYDGTLARHGIVEQSTLDALARFRATGRRLFMVTGREIEELRLTFSRFDLFDLVVAENGALLYDPDTGRFVPLHQPPPPRFAENLRAHGVAPLSVGHVVVATREPYETVVLQVIRSLGLELEIIFNKGAVMVLPTGVNKATGLAAALRDCGLRPEQTVAIGDAENDHAFLRRSGYGVAVSNAVAALKEQADYVTHASHGAGVVELIDLILNGQVPAAAPGAAVSSH